MNLTGQRRFLAPAVALGLLGATATAFVAGDRTGHTGLAQSLDVLGLLGLRSPGERSEATLTKVKHARAGSDGPGTDVLDARALGTEFAPAGVAAATEALGLATPEQLLAPAQPGGFVAPLAGAGGTGSPLPSLLFIGGGGGRSGGGGVGGGGSGGGGAGGNSSGTEPLSTEPSPEPSPDPSLQPTQLSAVPEPGTWAMMLVGMAMCGFALRRPGKRTSRSVKRPCALA